jgi:DNA-entry nuclease
MKWGLIMKKNMETRQKSAKQTRRLLLTLLLALAMTFTMAGCGTNTSSESSTHHSSSAASQEQTHSEQHGSKTLHHAVSASAANASGVKAGSSTGAVNLSKVPAYKNSPYTTLNGNAPSFSSSQLTRRSYEKYGSLDSLGRCTTAISSIGRDLMPTTERGSIGMIKPTGWHTIRYSFVDGKYLYNRCHLIGYQLTGENANERNLITGTRYMNVQGMEPFETEVADYIKHTGKHVLYRVTPIFKGHELVARGVHMEAESVEDHGRGIKFNIYCYNVQPGVKINYATGDSTATNGESGTHGGSTPSYSGSTHHSESSASTHHDNARHTYVVNVNTKVFHYPTCSSAKRTLEKNKRTMRVKRSFLIEHGYRPCKNCNP